MPKQNPPSLNDNHLTITVDKFKTYLKRQIDEGNLLAGQVQTGPYDKKFDNSFKEWSDYNFEFLKQSFNNPLNDQMHNYNQAGYSLMGQLGAVANNPGLSLLNLIEYKLSYLNSLFKRAELLKSTVNETQVTRPTSNEQTYSRDIFVVHGHDEAAKLNIARFIEKLGLRPIILHEQHNAGMTIIEKIEANTNVGFAVIIYTECDLGGKGPNTLQPRARQNVVFEHGYLMAKVGRSNVCALVKGAVETPSDISGVVYTMMDDNDGWHYKLAKELKASGYDIDMNKL